MEEADDVDVPDSIPARIPQKNASKPATNLADTTDNEDEKEEEEDNDADDGDEDEYQVEKILTHQYDHAGNVLYQIKWLGYEAESDLTWEPIDNL
jgi:chromobox protein 1